MGGAGTRLPRALPETKLVYDAHHLCTSLRIDGIIEVISRGILGCKQVVKLANASNRGRDCLGAVPGPPRGGGVVDMITFPPLNVNWTFRGEGGKAVEAIVRSIFGHVEQRSLHYLRESRTN